MTVEELMYELAKFPVDMLVVNQDSKYGPTEITELKARPCNPPSFGAASMLALKGVTMVHLS